MNVILQSLSIIGLFLLRLAVPLAITFLIAFYLRRLDAKWERELREQKPQMEKDQIAPSRPTPTLQMSTSSAIPTANDIFGKPCWEVKHCQEANKLNCAAFQNPELPCWWARFRAEGHIPEECYLCQIFTAWQFQPSDLLHTPKTTVPLH